MPRFEKSVGCQEESRSVMAPLRKRFGAERLEKGKWRGCSSCDGSVGFDSNLIGAILE